MLCGQSALLHTLFVTSFFDLWHRWDIFTQGTGYILFFGHSLRIIEMVVWENASRPAHLFLRFPFYSYSVWALVCFLDNMYMPKSLTAFYLQYISDFPLTLWAILILQTRVFCQRHESLRVLHSIFAVPRTVLYWTEISDVVCGIWWNHSPLALGTSQTLHLPFFWCCYDSL